MRLHRATPDGPSLPAHARTHPGEFELIARLKTVLDEARKGPDRKAPPPPVVDIGDDAAAVRRGKLVDIYTTDTMVDGVHFRRGQIRWRDLGWKAMVSNQSDVAAMGGQPLYALVTLGVPPEDYAEDLEEVYRGLAAAASKYGGEVVGGDVVRSPVLFITVALTGVAGVTAAEAQEARARALNAPVRQPEMPWDAALLRRDAAQPGDLIGITGPVGSSAGGLRALQRGLDTPDAQSLIRCHFRPEPRLAEALTLARNGVLAAMDVSDGLIADMEKIASMSRVQARIELANVPVSPALKRAFPEDWVDMALGGGEDYELLFTAPPSLMKHVLPLLEHQGSVIGEVTGPLSSEEPPVTVVDPDGQRVTVRHAGWDHLREA